MLSQNAINMQIGHKLTKCGLVTVFWSELMCSDVLIVYLSCLSLPTPHRHQGRVNCCNNKVFALFTNSSCLISILIINMNSASNSYNSNNSDNNNGCWQQKQCPKVLRVKQKKQPQQLGRRVWQFGNHVVCAICSTDLFGLSAACVALVKCSSKLQFGSVN